MNDSVPIFKNGKLEPGIYKIQNIVGQTYLDMREHTRELCCRPATLLDGKGLVGSRSYSTHTIALTVIFSGTSALQASDTRFAG